MNERGERERGEQRPKGGKEKAVLMKKQCSQTQISEKGYLSLLQQTEHVKQQTSSQNFIIGRYKLYQVRCQDSHAFKNILTCSETHTCIPQHFKMFQTFFSQAGKWLSKLQSDQKVSHLEEERRREKKENKVEQYVLCFYKQCFGMWEKRQEKRIPNCAQKQKTEVHCYHCISQLRLC